MREQAWWDVSWHELDQPLEVGARQELLFWREPPRRLDDGVRWMLHAGVWRPEEALVADCTVVAIRHPEWGEVTKADTVGLEYTLTLADGTELVVDAEEEPGLFSDRRDDLWAPSALAVHEWLFTVEL